MRQTRIYVVTRGIPDTDEGGGQDVTPVVVGTARVDVAQTSERERVLAHQAGTEHTHIGIRRDGQIVIERGDILTGDGNTFLVVATNYRAEARRWVLRLLRREPPHDD